MALSNDSPIDTPQEDLYRLDPFARAVAKSIEKMNAPEGLVLAVNGPWGSGKSSAINLIRHHLKNAIDNDEIVLIAFNPWWFSGADALVFSFLRELNAAIGDTLPKKARKALAVVGGGVSSLGPILGAATDLHAPGLGSLAGGAAELIGKLTKDGRTLDQEHKVVSQALLRQKKKFLVVIDDIDRLSPDDALTIFRLVKSVGRLPNVIYLLSFDRALAEKAVAERFPSEGPGYLEKIVQSAFDLPPPMPDVLRVELANAIIALTGDVPERMHVRFWNTFIDVVASNLRTPRDIVRIANDLKATWPAVADEVDRADFIALSAIKVLRPELYTAIRTNPDRLCGVQSNRTSRDDALQARYDAMLGLDALEEEDRLHWRMALRRLFPRLESVWSNVWRSDDLAEQRDRRLASRAHFDSYFAFSVSEDTLPANEIRQLVERADDEAFVKERLRAALTRMRRNGTTRAGLILEELNLHAGVIPEEKVGPLVSAIFALGQELDVEADDKKALMDIGNNPLRIHWLCNRLVTERFDIAKRDDIYEAAAQGAPFAWLTDFAGRCYRPYGPAEDDDPPRSKSDALVSEEVAKRLVALAVERIRQAAADGSLVNARGLGRILFEWRRFSEKKDEIRAWTDKHLAEDAFVIASAKMMISTAMTAGMGFHGDGDRVSTKIDRVDLKAYAEIVDVERHEKRVDELLASFDLDDGQRQFLTRYKSLPRKSHSED